MSTKKFSACVLSRESAKRETHERDKPAPAQKLEKMKTPNKFLGFSGSALEKQKGEGQKWSSHHARSLSLVLSPNPLSEPRAAT